MTIKIFDIKSTIISKNNARKNWHNHNFIFKECAKSTIEKIQELGKKFDHILLITSDFNDLLNEMQNLQFKKITILSQYEELNKKKQKEKKIKRISNLFEPLSLDGKFDLIICHLSLHRINDVIKFSSDLKKNLKKNGALVCSYFGGKTLIELRDSLIKTDEYCKKKFYQRVIPYIDMIDAGNIFSKAAFTEIVSDKTSYTIKYNNFSKLLNDIKGVGESNCLTNRNKGLMTKSFLNILEKIYSRDFKDSDSDFIVTCEVISLTMWNS